MLSTFSSGADRRLIFPRGLRSKSMIWSKVTMKTSLRQSTYIYKSHKKTPNINSKITTKVVVMGKKSSSPPSRKTAATIAIAISSAGNHMC